jgi:hypothetical protein
MNGCFWPESELNDFENDAWFCSALHGFYLSWVSSLGQQSLVLMIFEDLIEADGEYVGDFECDFQRR